MKIKCLCIDDAQKPIQIPNSKWVVKGKEYHVTHVYKQMQQPGVQGVELAEIDISNYFPYNCYRLSRFAFKKEDLPKLFEMIQNCSELNDIDITNLIESLETVDV